MPRNPDQRSVHINAPLTSVSVAWMQSQTWAADVIFPRVPVQKQGDLYWVYPRGAWFSAQAERRAPGTESAGGGWTVETDSYYAHVYAIHQDVDDQTLANADSQFDIEADAARWCTTQLGQKREAEFVSSFLAQSVWATDTDVSAAWDTDTTDIVSTIRDAASDMKGATGFRPNTLAVSADTWEGFMKNADLLDRIKYTQPGAGTAAKVSAGLVAGVLDLDRVVVVDSVQQPSTGGDDLEYTWSNSALLCYSAPQPGLRQPTAGYTFTWNGLLGAGAGSQRVKRFRMEELESTRVEAEMAYAQKVVATELGHYFHDTVA